MPRRFSSPVAPFTEGGDGRHDFLASPLSAFLEWVSLTRVAVGLALGAGCSTGAMGWDSHLHPVSSGCCPLRSWRNAFTQIPGRFSGRSSGSAALEEPWIATADPAQPCFAVIPGLERSGRPRWIFDTSWFAYAPLIQLPERPDVSQIWRAVGMVRLARPPALVKHGGSRCFCGCRAATGEIPVDGHRHPQLPVRPLAQALGVWQDTFVRACGRTLPLDGPSRHSHCWRYIDRQKKWSIEACCAGSPMAWPRTSGRPAASSSGRTGSAVVARGSHRASLGLVIG